MSIHALKGKLVNAILKTHSEKLIRDLYSVLEKEENDFWLDLTEDQKKEVELGLDQIKKGETVSLEDFLKQVS